MAVDDVLSDCRLKLKSRPKGDFLWGINQLNYTTEIALITQHNLLLECMNRTSYGRRIRCRYGSL